MSCEERRKSELDCLNLLLSYKTSNRIVKQLIGRLSSCCISDLIVDRPDIVMFADDIVYGIEHFRVNSALLPNSNGSRVVFADNKYRELTYKVLKQGQLELSEYDDLSEDTLQKVCSNFEELFRLEQQTTYFDYCSSFSTAFEKHVNKLCAYKENILRHGMVEKLVLYFLIDVSFPFRRLHLPIDCGCITPDILCLFEKTLGNALLDGIILVMHDMVDLTKCAVFFVDMHDYERSIRRQRMRQSQIPYIFQHAPVLPVPSVSCVRDNGYITFKHRIQRGAADRYSR